jgi:hypothetical protein
MEHLLAATNKVVELNNQLTAVTEQRDEARRLAEKYRYLSCDSQAQARPALPDAECFND